MRFPTIAHNEGAKIGAIDLPYVSYQKTCLNKYEGIYHAIKEPFLGSFQKNPPPFGRGIKNQSNFLLTQRPSSILPNLPF